jgi:hypothetical protein
MGKFYGIKKSSNTKKNTAWKWFSVFVRTRDSIATTGTTTHAQCITCGKVYPINELDAGHAIAGRSNAILFNEDLCHAQCRRCNRMGGGELQAYKRILVEKHGQEKWDMWEASKRHHVEYTQFDYEQMAKSYRKRTKELKETSNA